MRFSCRLFGKLIASALAVGFGLFCVCPLSVHAAGSDMSAAGRAMVAALRASGVRVALDRQRGVARFVGASRSAAMQVPGVTPGASPTFNALLIADKYGSLFGLAKPREELQVKREGKNSAGGGMVHYQQLFKGLPVIGGEIIVNMDRGGAMLSMNGRSGAIPKSLAVAPVIGKNKAAKSAVAAVAKWYKFREAALEVSDPVLAVYEPRLIGPASSKPAELVWRMEVRPRKLAPIREFVLVDTQHGGIALHFNQVDTAKNRLTYSANNSATLPGTLKCDEATGDACTSGVDTEADFAHLYAGKTYDFYLDYHGRDSFDGAGATLISSVNFNDGVTCPNAYWDGTQMVYCQGFPEADDVVAHELTHAVTERTSNLFYYYQSGAINESLSDLWGEFVDQTDGYGNDTAAVKWLLGEDLVAPRMTGAIRDMKNPPAYHQPDKMSSTLYYTGSDDSGGVHTNSGINNKAVYLMTDGATFNGQTVVGLGIAKVAKIYYEAQTNLLTSGADYLDLDNALNQACSNLIGTSGITASDCTQVLAATTAVEMGGNPSADFNPEAQVCPDGQTVNDVFFDDMESGPGKWVMSQTSTAAWTFDTGYATSGVAMLYGQDVDFVSDHSVAFADSVLIPGGQPYLHFRHAFDFEQSGTKYYDGGVLEYSTNNGSTWNNALGYFDSGKNYNGTIDSGTGNPLSGRSGYVGISHGYVSTRLNLAALAGQNVKFRWRVGTDTSVESYGWFLDDVRIYTCGAGNLAPTANAGAPQSVAKGATVTLNGTASSDSDGTIASYSWAQTGGTPSVTLNNATTATPSFTAPASATTLTFRLTVTDNQGASASATTTVTTTNVSPVAEAGAAQTVNTGVAVTLNGTASSDPDGTIVSYAWSQTGGTAVTLNNATTATPSFSAPGGATTLTFQLTVTDNDGAIATDTTTVTVKVPPTTSAPAADGGGGGGGCSLSRDGGSDPILMLVFLGSVVVIWRKRQL